MLVQMEKCFIQLIQLMVLKHFYLIIAQNHMVENAQLLIFTNQITLNFHNKELFLVV